MVGGLGVLERIHLKTNSLTFLLLFFRLCRVYTGIPLGSLSRLKYDDASEDAFYQYSDLII